jgi:anti-sigma regulatory factor (Ser/Thr protein kinase)
VQPHSRPPPGSCGCVVARVIDQATESLLLAPDARAPSASRRFVAAALARWELADLTDTAVLLTSELVTNAIVHAQTEVAVTIRRENRGGVTISVHDGSSIQPRRSAHAEDATTGRGLAILEQLAASWEVIRQGAGKTVLFTLNMSSGSA